MRRKKSEFKTLNADEKQLANLKDFILQCKKNIAQNTVDLGMYLYCAKEQVSHGEWGKWLADNADFTERTSSRFIKVYKTTIELDEKYDEAIGNLNSSQLIEISALKKTDIENLLDTDDIKDMSVRELQQVIKDIKVKNKQPKKSKSDNVDRFEKETSLAIIDIPIETDTKRIYTDVWILNNELRNRAESDEDIEVTLVAIYNAKEINHQQFNDTVIQHKLNLPIFFLEKSLEEYLDRFDNNFYSDYEHYDNNSNEDLKVNRTYYSIFDKELEWQEATKCWDKNDENAIDWSKSNNVDNGLYQLAHAYIDTSEYLCIYKDYVLQGTYRDGEWTDIDRLGTYDRANLPAEKMKDIELLYNKLEKQMKLLEQRQAIRQEKEHAEYVRKQAKQKKYDDVLREWKECYQPYSMGRYTFEDIYNNETGEIKNYKLYREMTDFVIEEKQKKQDKYKNYDWGNMFGGSSSIAVKEEDKPMYKRAYKVMAKNFHPDIVKDDGSMMQFVNNLKEQWGI